MVRKQNTEAGFSLIEILVVIVIMGVLAGVVAVNLVGKPGEARQAACVTQMQTIKTALKMYKTEQGSYPNQRQGIIALVEAPNSPPLPKYYPEEGYLESYPLDPWKNEFIYLIPGSNGKKYEIISYGSDGEPGGEGENADISSLSF